MSCPKFKSLQAEWYERLREAGFEDHETPRGDLRDVDHRTIARAFEDRHKREAYYERVDDVLHRYQFENDTERRIWELHAEGLPVRTIGELTQKHPATVQWTIKRLRLKTKLERP